MESLQTRVLVTLRDQILKGEFVPGERLTEVGLAEKLKVSRTPIRVALATLEREGLVESNATGGFLMRGFTPREIDHAITIRGTLESLAVRMLAEHGASPKLMAELKACLADGDRLLEHHASTLLEDFTAYTEMNDRFHTLILQGARSTVLERTMEHVMRISFAGPSALVSGPVTQFQWLVIAHHHQHHALVEAIEHRQSGRAQALAEEHVNIARANLKAVLERPEMAQTLMPGIRYNKSPSAEPQNPRARTPRRAAKASVATPEPE